MKRTTFVLAGAVAGAALLSGCGQQSPLRQSAMTAATPATTAPVADVTAPLPPGAASAKPARAHVRTGRPANALDWHQPALNDEDLDHAVRASWANAHGVSPHRVLGDQLLLGLAENGQLLVGAYQLWVSGGQAHVVVAQAEPRSEAVLVSDVLARPDVPVVAAAVARRSATVVASVAPGTTKVEYRSRAGASWTVIAQDSLDLVFARAASPAAGEALRLTGNGRVVLSPVTGQLAAQPEQGAPANVLLWPGRGEASAGPAPSVVAKAYAKAMGASSAQVRRLFSGSTDSGVRYLVGQAWVQGKPAQTIGYAMRPGREGELHIQPATPRGARVVAFLVTELPGTTTDLLVVVPEPRTSQVSYRMSSTASWHPAYTDSFLDGVYLVDRTKTPADDSLQLLTGNGDPTDPATLVVRVSKVLCDGAGCP